MCSCDIYWVFINTSQPCMLKKKFIFKFWSICFKFTIHMGACETMYTLVFLGRWALILINTSLFALSFLIVLEGINAIKNHLMYHFSDPEKISREEECHISLQYSFLFFNRTSRVHGQQIDEKDIVKGFYLTAPEQQMDEKNTYLQGFYLTNTNFRRIFWVRVPKNYHFLNFHKKNYHATGNMSKKTTTIS